MKIKSKEHLENRFLEFLLEDSNKEIQEAYNNYNIMFGNIINPLHIDLMGFYQYKFEYMC